MDNVKKELIQKIQTREEVFALFSRATRQPFVICDAESFNDQVWIFEDKEDLEKAAQPIAAEKNAVAGIKVENKSFLNFYTTLYTLGVVYHEKDKKTELELEEIVREPDFSVLPEEKRPLLNPQLQLSAIYFMQEFRRDVEMSEKTSLPELEEEVAANVVKSKFLLAVEKKGEEENVQVPYVKNQNGDVFQPVFTDAEEFRRFNQEGKFQALLVTFENMEKVLIPIAKGIVINPNSFNLILPKEKMNALKQRFGM